MSITNYDLVRPVKLTAGGVNCGVCSVHFTARELDRLVNHAKAQIETLGTKAYAVGQIRVAGSAQVQLQRAMRNISTNGQRIHGRAEASLAVVGSNQPLETTVSIPPI